MPGATSSQVSKSSPTIATSYGAAGKIVGGLITLSDVTDRVKATLILYSLVFKHFGANANELSVLVFDDAPASIGADGADLTLIAADFAKLVAAIPIVADDYVVAGSKATAQPNLKPVVIRPTAKALYAVIVTTAAATFAAVDAASLHLGFLKD